MMLVSENGEYESQMETRSGKAQLCTHRKGGKENDAGLMVIRGTTEGS